MRNFFHAKKTRVALLMSLILTAVACFTVFFTLDALSHKSPSNVLADCKVELENELNQAIEDNYYVGTDVNWPSEIEVEVEDGGNPVTVTANNGVILWPNGTASKTGSSTLLYQTGWYTIRYTYDNEGQFDYIEKQVFVGEKLTTFAMEDGIINPLTKEEQEGLTFENNASEVTLQKQDALIVKMKEGNTLYYTKSIDLTDVDPDTGLCSLITIDYHLLDNTMNGPSYKFQESELSATNCIIRLTDAYDPSIYVDLAYGQRSQYGDISRTGTVNVRAYNQSEWAGAHVAPETWGDTDYTWRKMYTLNGVRYGIYRFNEPRLGSNADFDLTNKNHTAITWKYDPVNQFVYYNCGTQAGLENDKFLSPLNDARVHGAAFPGFSSNKVRLSIFMTDWASSNYARVDVFGIGDTSGEDLLGQFSDGHYYDDVATPVIDLGVKYTEGNSVNVAMNTEFEVPVPAKITGMMGGVTYGVRAYVNYGTPSEFEVPVVDGKVKIDKNAIYTLRYSAMNSAGAVGYENLILKVVSSADAGIMLDMNEAYFNGAFKGGQVVQLPEHELTSINIQDDLKLKITARHAEMDIDVDLTTRSFTLPYSGAYKIIYEYSDNVYNIVKEFEIEAEADDAPGFLDTVTIPKYFIKDATYSLPKMVGYKLGGSSLVPINVQTYVSFDGGEFELVDRAEVYIDGNTSVQVKYVCSAGGKSAEILSSVSTIVDVNYASEYELRYSDYFIHDGFDCEPYDWDLYNDTIIYSSTTTTGNNTLQFINAIDVSNLEVQYGADENSNYRKINVKLIDYYKPTNKYVISIENVNGNAHVSFNGAPAIDTKTLFAQSVARVISYSMDTNILKFGADAKTVFDLRSYFTTPLCYLEIELEGISGPADITLYRINGQFLTNEPIDDFTKPRISTVDFSGNYSINSIVTIYKPTITDVISPVLDGTIVLNVTHTASGDYVRDINGKELRNVSGLEDYTILLDRLGEYKVSYRFKDCAMNSSSKTYNIIVIDTETPVITFNKVELTKVKVKVGANIDASFTVTDNVTEVKKLITSLWVKDLNANVNYTIHNDTGIIHFNRAGSYVIYAFAQDEAGNYAYKTIEVIVENEV